jgi:hypothetical protein
MWLASSFVVEVDTAFLSAGAKAINLRDQVNSSDQGLPLNNHKLLKVVA